MSFNIPDFEPDGDDDDFCCPDCGAREDEPHEMDCDYDDDEDTMEDTNVDA